MSNTETLLIFNGDYACNCWRQNEPAVNCSTLVWRENYLEGPLPADVPLPEFERVRAEFLHSCVPEYTTAEICRSLMNHHTVLENFNTPDAEIVLYFDCCMYDMIMLARIFYLLKNHLAKIRLFCEDVVLGNAPEVFGKAIDSLREISPDTVDLYAYAWECVLQGAAGVAHFNSVHAAEKEPFLAEAMTRYGEDHPVDGSFGRSRRQLLEIVNSGISDFKDIFQAFDRYEKYMFMGDTHCLRLLDELVQNGFVRKELSGGNNRYPVFFKVTTSRL